MSDNRFFLATMVVFSVLLSACASGSSIVTGSPKAPIDASLVNIHLESPENYEVIGIVKASSDAGWTQQGSVNYAVEELKSQAAKIGANGVLIESTFGSSLTGQSVTGKAIYITP